MYQKSVLIKTVRFTSQVPVIVLQTILQQSDLIIDDMRKERDALRAQVTTWYSTVYCWANA